MLELERVLQLVNNLDHREALRRYGPAWSVVLVNEQLEVVAVERFKEQPAFATIDPLTSQHKNCAYFYAQPGMYPTTEALREKIKGCADAFRVQWG